MDKIFTSDELAAAIRASHELVVKGYSLHRVEHDSKKTTLFLRKNNERAKAEKSVEIPRS